jgi:hypothetical protein
MRLPRRLVAQETVGGDAGFALISAVALMSLVAGFGILITHYVLSTRTASKHLETQVYTTQLAEAGLFKALFCLNSTDDAKCGGVAGPDYTGESDIIVDTGRFTSTVTGTGTERQLTVTGYTASGQRKTLRADLSSLPPYSPIQFAGPVHGGGNGVLIYNQAVVRGGTINADSSLTCGSNVTLYGNVSLSKGGANVSYCGVQGNLHGHHVQSCTVSGNITYVGTASGNTAYSITKIASNPAPVPMPQFDLAYWQARAERGGVLYGTQSPAAGASLGPTKIVGDLTLGTGVNLTLTGPVWVTGTVTMNENSSISLHPSFDAYSSVLLGDNPANQATGGKIIVNPNAVVNGSGNAKSFILLVSTNTSLVDANPALDIGNNAGGGLFYAVNGTVRVRNNASATAVAGSRVFIDQNGIVDSSSGLRDLTDIRLSVLPPGTWRVEGTSWRETNQ